MPNTLDSDQNDGPDLGPNCLQGLSAVHTSKQRVKIGPEFGKVNYVKPTTHHLKFAADSIFK